MTYNVFSGTLNPTQSIKADPSVLLPRDAAMLARFWES